jgi:hypothetical protein
LVVGITLYVVLMTVLFWRQVGSWLQAHFTTRRATPAELASGIRAGKELLRRHLATPNIPERPLQRIWQMGFIQVALGIIAMTALLSLLDGPLDGMWLSLLK